MGREGVFGGGGGVVGQSGWWELHYCFHDREALSSDS